MINGAGSTAKPRLDNRRSRAGFPQQSPHSQFVYANGNNAPILRHGNQPKTLKARSLYLGRESGGNRAQGSKHGAPVLSS
jgi:hypothetical protein